MRRGAPLALAVFAMGFGMQYWGSTAQQPASDPVLESLLAAPESTPLEQIESQRAPRRVGNRHAGVPLLSEPDQGPPLPLEIRVALLNAGPSPRLSATGPWRLLSRDGDRLQQGDAGQMVDLSVALQQGEAWLVSPPGQSLLVNGRAYGGRLRLVTTGGGLQLVNHLDLEHYIAAVVGAEMPSSWPQAALMAQAVAARSYALAHMARPASRHWHLGDTTRWQAYRGLERVNQRTREAASRTAGLILSYQGGIVESLYAANQQITLEAHGHLGASMSQHGARQLAEAGHPYNAILGRYYPGASLARLRAGAG